MTDFQAQISTLVDKFVAQVTVAAREAAMQTLHAALGATHDVIARRRAGTSSVAAAPTASTASLARPTAAPRAAVVNERAKGEKRPQDEIQALRERLVEFIRLNPGLRVEQINRQLGTTTKDVALPLRRLAAEGAIRTEGEKRSTQYFPAGSARAAAPSPAAAPPAVRRRHR